MLRVALFFIVSAAILLLSWRSLRDLRTHGFYRFFGFEMLLALILLNAPVWFLDPFSARQIAAWLLGAISIGLAIEGFRQREGQITGPGDQAVIAHLHDHGHHRAHGAGELPVDSPPDAQLR